METALKENVAEKCRLVFGSTTHLLSLAVLAGDASSRRYYRARLTNSRAPASIIVMEIPGGSALPLASEELAIFKEPLKELPFFNLHRFLSGIGVRVPHLYGQWETERIFFLEDLGDVTLWDRVQGQPQSEILAWYCRAIDELLVLQVRGTRNRDNDCIAFQQRFDFRLYMWEFDHFLEFGWRAGPGASASQATAHTLRQSFEDIARRLDSQIPCLNHRDYHSWNLMIHDNAIAVIDFQDGLLAPMQYDLASLLNDRITDQVIQSPLEEALIDYYIGKREALDEARIDREEFFEIYLLSAIQRDLKVIGRFFYLDIVKGKPGYKQFIPATVRRLRRNLERLPRLQRTIPLLAERFEEMG